MKKRIIALILLMSMLVAPFAAYGTPVYAKSAAKISGVDYSRIHADSEDAKCEVILNIGGYGVSGWLTAGNGISMEDLNEIIKGKMEKWSLNSNALNRMEKHIAKVADLYGISVTEVILATGMDLLLDKYKDLKKIKYGADVVQACSDLLVMDLGDIASIAVGTAGGLAVTASAATGMTAAFATVLVSLTAAEVKQIVNALQKGENPTEIAKAICESMLLMQFYDDCNREIEARGYKDTKRITFSGESEFSDQSFMGIGGNELIISVNGILDDASASGVQNALQESGYNKQNVFSGTYTGDLEIDIRYNLDSFDSMFLDEIILNRMNLRQLEGTHDFYDDYDKTILIKHLTLNDVTVTIDGKNERYGNTKEYYIPLDGAKDRSAFVLKHDVALVPAGIFPITDSSGHYSFAGIDDGTIVTNMSFTGHLEANRYTALDIDTSKSMYKESVPVPIVGTVTYGDVLPSHTMDNYVKDNDPFKMLANGIKMIIDFNRAQYK